jgi:membrane-anchored protein YejM (alkaline phosphatase superfamily)
MDPATGPGGGVETNNVPDLFKEALKKRLESMSIHVADKDTDSVPTLELTLKQFFLDLKDRTWFSDLSYEVKLSKDGTKTGKEQIHAQAERTKVMGKAGGEKLIGEILTEGINKLNLNKLFENAGF